MILLLNLPVYGKSPACSDFEAKCDALVKALDADVERLKDDVSDCEDKLSSVQPSLPFYVWVGLGIIIGGAGTLYLARR